MIDDPEAAPCGVFALDAETARWRVWASRAERVELILNPDGAPVRYPMTREGHGYFVADAPLSPNIRYGYSLDGGPARPDPASRWQPDGIETPSAVYFPEKFAWNEGQWSGIHRADLVFYELHVGTFTPEGTFAAIIPRIGELLELGITAIELMPVAQFSGRIGWGYDAVFPFAVHNTYGGPEELHRLVEACHQKEMAIFLDVIYNHVGPEGNLLPTYADYFTEKYKTDWGPAVNYDGRGCDAVRAMVLDNVRMWIRDYRFDGLRLDAADQIYDRSPTPILADVATLAHAEGARLGRTIHVFAETDLNDAPRFLHPPDRGGYGLDGHWNDDFHHAVHVVLTGETSGYYVDFAAGPQALAKTYQHIFVNNGNYSVFRGRRHGTPATGFPGDRFVAFTQNHDQVGNRLKSDRFAATLPESALRLAAGLLLLSPRLPLLFMGEEYGETRPFPFFCDFHSPELVAAVRKGRKAEFAHFGWKDEIIDPCSLSTRDSAVLTWDWTEPARLRLRTLYRDLLELRRETPDLRDFRHPATRLLNNEAVLEVVRGSTMILFNLTKVEQAASFAAGPFFRSGESKIPGILGPHEFALCRFTPS